MLLLAKRKRCTKQASVVCLQRTLLPWVVAGTRRQHTLLEAVHDAVLDLLQVPRRWHRAGRRRLRVRVAVVLQ